MQIDFVGLAMAAWALHQGQTEEALILSDELLATTTSAGARTWAVDAAALRVEALLALNRRDEALTQLRQAIAEAEATHLYRTLWRLLVVLADLEDSRGELEEASALRDQARAVIQDILPFNTRPEHQAAFLAQPEVRRLLDLAAPARS